jgi:hypothetical protein
VVRVAAMHEHPRRRQVRTVIPQRPHLNE